MNQKDKKGKNLFPKNGYFVFHMWSAVSAISKIFFDSVKKV